MFKSAASKIIIARNNVLKQYDIIIPILIYCKYFLNKIPIIL